MNCNIKSKVLRSRGDSGSKLAGRNERGVAFRPRLPGGYRAAMTDTGEYPQLFQPHANLSDAVNGNIVQSEIEGGVHLRDLLPGTVLEVRTQNRAYTILYKGFDQALISGHPVFCPQPVAVTIHGS